MIPTYHWACYVGGIEFYGSYIMDEEEMEKENKEYYELALYGI